VLSRWQAEVGDDIEVVLLSRVGGNLV